MLDQATNLCAESNLIPDGNGQAGASPTSLVPNNGNDVEQFEDKSGEFEFFLFLSLQIHNTTRYRYSCVSAKTS